MIQIQTSTGRIVDLESFRPQDVDLLDIARGLSNCCRFAGQIDQFYSVGQHAIFVSRLVPGELALHALHHDDSEAYLGDLSRNLKHHPGLAGYREIEASVSLAIEQALGLRPLSRDEHVLIKAADDLAAIVEAVTLRMGRAYVAADIYRAVRTGFVKTHVDHLMAANHRLQRLPERAATPVMRPQEVYRNFRAQHAALLTLPTEHPCPRCGERSLTADAGFLCTIVHCPLCSYSDSDMGFSL